MAIYNGETYKELYEERSRFANAYEYTDESDNGIKRYTVVIAYSSGSTIDLKRPSTQNHLVTVNGGIDYYSGWILSVGTGAFNSDQIILDPLNLPPTGDIYVTYEIEYSKKEEWVGKREEIEIFSDTEYDEYVTNGTETLWQIAGRPDVYNDTSWWWVIVDANKELNGFFRYMMNLIPRDTVLKIPLESEVAMQLGVNEE